MATWYKPVVPGAGGDPRKLLPGVPSDAMVIPARRDECRVGAILPRDFESKNAKKPQRPLQVGDLEMKNECGQ